MREYSCARMRGIIRASRNKFEEDRGARRSFKPGGHPNTFKEEFS